jgi:hypothetical protein
MEDLHSRDSSLVAEDPGQASDLQSLCGKWLLIRAYAHAGRRADALRLLAELKQRSKSGYVPAGAFVNAYLGLGENDQAFAALDQAYKEQSNILQFLKVHPYFDPLRSDPRFAALVLRVGLV